MPANSERQRRLLAAARAYKRGESTGTVSTQIKELANTMTDKDLTDFMTKKACAMVLEGRKTAGYWSEKGLKAKELALLEKTKKQKKKDDDKDKDEDKPEKPTRPDPLRRGTGPRDGSGPRAQQAEKESAAQFIGNLRKTAGHNPVAQAANMKLYTALMGNAITHKGSAKPGESPQRIENVLHNGNPAHPASEGYDA